MNETGNNNSISAKSVPQESSISKRARELMQCAAKLHGREYVEMPPYVPGPSRREAERLKEIEQETSHEVYFLYSCNRVKIGMSKHHQRRILQDISPYCPAPHWLLGVIPGGSIVESRLHERFKNSLISNEWFELTPELRKFLRENEHRADVLDEAEDDYKDWLEDELAHQEERHANKSDQP